MSTKRSGEAKVEKFATNPARFAQVLRFLSVSKYRLGIDYEKAKSVLSRLSRIPQNITANTAADIVNATGFPIETFLTWVNGGWHSQPERDSLEKFKFMDLLANGESLFSVSEYGDSHLLPDFASAEIEANRIDATKLATTDKEHLLGRHIKSQSFRRDARSKKNYILRVLCSSESLTRLFSKNRDLFGEFRKNLREFSEASSLFPLESNAYSTLIAKTSSIMGFGEWTKLNIAEDLLLGAWYPWQAHFATQYSMVNGVLDAVESTMRSCFDSYNGWHQEKTLGSELRAQNESVIKQLELKLMKPKPR